MRPNGFMGTNVHENHNYYMEGLNNYCVKDFEKYDWWRAFNQFAMACEVGMII